ncbi:MAG TPA: GFA family protein [Myxococcota bacterium]|nr:GFA family protein [Myxococcota bacterium]
MTAGDAQHALAPLTGGCACGALRYEARGAAANLCFCHCASCRRATGASPVAWGTFARERFRVVRGALALRRSSPPVERGFCAACGTALTYAHAARPSEIDVTLASLDEPAALRPACHIWVSDRIAWAPLADGLPQYSGWRTEG